MKRFPQNYSEDAVKILTAMSFTNGKSVELKGSMALRHQLYAGDFDAFEIVSLDYDSIPTALDHLAHKLQSNIKHLETISFVGDFKSGIIKEWEVIGTPYNYDKSLDKIEELATSKVITPEEKREALALIKPHLSRIDILKARDTLKFHVVRWSIAEIKKGYKYLRDDRKYTLQEAFYSPSLTKLDVIGLVGNSRYTDFSMIYQFENKGTILNPLEEDIEQKLKDDIALYKAEDNPFKALKRQFSLARLKNQKKKINAIIPILNSDRGRLYSVSSDIGTLIDLLNGYSPSLKTVRFELDQFKNRLANVWDTPSYLRAEPQILQEINQIIQVKSKKLLVKRLQHLKNKMDFYIKKSI